jgi:hypothetical protein
MLSFEILLALATALLVDASSLNIRNDCSFNVTVQVADPSGVKYINIPARTTIGNDQGVPQSGPGIALSFVTDNAQLDKAMSRAEINFTPGNPSGNTFINLSNMFGYSVPLELTGSGCHDYVCNISGCPVPGPNGSCTSPCCSSFDGCMGASSCPNGNRPDQPHGGPGPYSGFYKGACPNSYAWGEQDSDEPNRDLASYCSGDDIQVVACTSKPSSNL